MGGKTSFQISTQNKKTKTRRNLILRYLTASQDGEMDRDMGGGMDSRDAGAYGDAQTGRDRLDETRQTDRRTDRQTDRLAW